MRTTLTIDEITRIQTIERSMSKYNLSQKYGVGMKQIGVILSCETPEGAVRFLREVQAMPKKKNVRSKKKKEDKHTRSEKRRTALEPMSRPHVPMYQRSSGY